MSGRHKFTELEAKIAPERRARIAGIAEELASEIERAKLRTEARCQKLLQLLREHPGGLTRRQIIEKLRVPEDEETESSILEALNELAQHRRIVAREGMYLTV